jgi:uncharacterized membrane protein YhaH (DUF805 family)
MDLHASETIAVDPAPARPDRTGPRAAVRQGVRGWASFSGRASRGEYWWFFLFVVLLARLIDVGAAFLFLAFVSDGMHPILAALIWTGIQLASAGWSVMAVLSASVRRVHDTGRSAWWLLVPAVNLILLLSPTRDAH